MPRNLILNSSTCTILFEYQQIIAYSTLLRELDIVSVRALEDLIIDTIYGVSLMLKTVNFIYIFSQFI
jgi:hypothetical protein